MDYKEYIRDLLIKKDDNIYKTNKYKAASACIEILEEEITNFKYDSNRNIGYLFHLLNVVAKLLKGNETLQNNFFDKFTYIHNNMQSIIHAKPEELSKIEENRYKLLKNLINKLENTALLIYSNSPAEFDHNKAEFIYYIVYKLKYINLFSAACEKFPHIVNSIDRKGKPLVESVLDHYLESLDRYISKANLGPIDDLIYYEKILRIIINSESVNIDNYSKIKMLDKVKKFATRKNFKSNRHKEKFSFFVNNIIDVINGEEENKSIDFLSYKYEVHSNFKEAHNYEAYIIQKKNNYIGDITTNRKIYTFDGENAKELDDGISLIYENGTYHLGVHIANPGLYIPDESILMDEAKRRTTSLYMGNECIPLFPISISGDTMSLNEGKNSYCTSYYFDINSSTGDLENFNIKNEIVRITKNYTYDYFNETLDQGCEDQEFFDFLINFTNLSEILKQTYNEDSIYHEFHNDKDQTIATNTVASAMIYTNYNIAKYFSEHNLPFIYRCHTINEEDIKELTALQERLKNNNNTTHIIKDIEMMKKLFPRAYYTSENNGHYGLGIDYYCHATSPLRRFADNVVNMCINKFIINDYKNDDIFMMKDYIDEVSEIVNTRRNSLEDYEIQYMKLKYENKR